MKELIEQYSFGRRFNNYLSKVRLIHTALLLVSIILAVNPAHSLIIGADGGITLWVSCDNVDSPGISIDDNVTQGNSTDVASCTPTNNARAAQWEANSPSSYPAAGGDTCSGRDKLLGDITNLAEYIYTSTHGKADTTTMEQIADNTNSSVTPMSELDSAGELKLNMARKFTTLCGNSPIYTHKGSVTKTGEDKRSEYLASEFYIPPKTKDVLFYVFLGCAFLCVSRKKQCRRLGD
jgi:hypothetical protein